MMSKVFSFFKALRLNRILTALLISTLMLFSTACNRVNAAEPGIAKAADDPHPPGQVQPYEGGMNNYNDVDTTRFDKGSVDAKAKALKDRVQRNINEKGVDSVDQYVENYRSGTPLNERIENIGDDVRRTADDAKENLQEFGDRGSKNLEQNAKQAPGQAARTADQAKENVKAAGGSVIDNAKKAADKVGKGENRVQ